ncbi:MAG TPA: response regulator [Allosphingosinicella sp.]|uniref:response regulator transcription factor n=1 Tax=Allosphingosinicella sp. TaxID=2823234 RepID=UPI002ED81D0E
MNEAQASTKSRTIYVVDDDADVRGSIEFLLAAGGRATASFSTGTAFLSEVGKLTPGCILLDVRMPDMDGSDVLKELSRQKVDWPVVIMTGHGDLDLAVQMMTLGAVDYLEKPFEGAALRDALHRAETILDHPDAFDTVNAN